tara:strand:+ start:2491 stop:3180 length:690 start_codon:yes stop_codon:yes gene_type:complete
MTINPYEVLGVNTTSDKDEIKLKYRKLVKRYHPDTGGDKKKIILINAAWEILRDDIKRSEYDKKYINSKINNAELKTREKRNVNASKIAKLVKNESIIEDQAIENWISKVYRPIDKSLGKIITPFKKEIQNLSADPYNDLIMNDFCDYIKRSQMIIRKVDKIYCSTKTPTSLKDFSLDIYHCLSKVKDALIELDRYTLGYVDNYLHDGAEMISEAKKIRALLKKQRNNN